MEQPQDSNTYVHRMASSVILSNKGNFRILACGIDLICTAMMETPVTLLRSITSVCWPGA